MATATAKEQKTCEITEISEDAKISVSKIDRYSVRFTWPCSEKFDVKLSKLSNALIAIRQSPKAPRDMKYCLSVKDIYKPEYGSAASAPCEAAFMMDGQQRVKIFVPDQEATILFSVKDLEKVLDL